jgi:hypothetical protein
MGPRSRCPRRRHGDLERPLTLPWQGWTTLVPGRWNLSTKPAWPGADLFNTEPCFAELNFLCLYERLNQAAGTSSRCCPARTRSTESCNLSSFLDVKRSASPNAATTRWAKKLAADVAAVMSRHPGADPEDVRLTLISLQSPPLTRLNRSLRRGRGFAAFRR